MKVIKNEIGIAIDIINAIKSQQRNGVDIICHIYQVSHSCS